MIAASTRARVAAETGRFPVTTCETVDMLTPAASATSRIPTMRSSLLRRRKPYAQKVLE
nr:hypothetical protein GCM10025730_12560 [Promicromonospora thailandica]